jgi:hypothetical protein
MYVQYNMYCTNIDTNRYSKEKDIEICAVKLHFSSHTVVIISVYRSPAEIFILS